MSDVDMTDLGGSPPTAPQEAAPPAPPMPVVQLFAPRSPDDFDVVIDNVIVGRHSDPEVRTAIVATNTPLLEQVKAALAPI